MVSGQWCTTLCGDLVLWQGCGATGNWFKKNLVEQTNMNVKIRVVDVGIMMITIDHA